MEIKQLQHLFLRDKYKKRACGGQGKKEKCILIISSIWSLCSRNNAYEWTYLHNVNFVDKSLYEIINEEIINQLSMFKQFKVAVKYIKESFKGMKSWLRKIAT